MIDVQVDLHRTEAEVAKDSLEILNVEDPAAQADQVQKDQVQAAPDQKDDVLTVPQADRKVDQ